MKPRFPHFLLSLLLGFLLSLAPSSAALTQSFQQTGNLGLEFTGAPGQGNNIVSGNLTLSSMPLTATAVRATLYVDQTNNSAGLDANFGGTALNGGVLMDPSASDSHIINTFYTYQWDVTALFIPAVNTYSFTVGQNTLNGSNIAGIGLSVVWSDATAPLSTVTLIEGMRLIGESGPETENAIFTGLPAGATDAWLFTTFDDNTHSGETISYNSSTIGNNIDQNLGLNASVLNYSATSTAGNNTLSITTGQDVMAWMVAGTVVTVPEPSSAILTLIALSAACLLGRRRAL